jgi:cell division septation protein DedD
MSRDYKPMQQKASNGKTSTSRGGSFLTGLLVGFLLGVAASLAVTMYIKGSDSPFAKSHKQDTGIFSETLSSKLPKAKPVTATPNNTPNNENPDSTITEAETENQFDFYTILPETESTVTEQEINDSALTVKKDNYFLQVGAFTDEADADNMKAKLALQGFEAVVQTASIPDKGVWHRVRVGPLSDIEQINKIRDDLSTNGFNADLIKVHTETKPE